MSYVEQDSIEGEESKTFLMYVTGPEGEPIMSITKEHQIVLYGKKEGASDHEMVRIFPCGKVELRDQPEGAAVLFWEAVGVLRHHIGEIERRSGQRGEN